MYPSQPWLQLDLGPWDGLRRWKAEMMWFRSNRSQTGWVLQYWIHTNWISNSNKNYKLINIILDWKILIERDAHCTVLITLPTFKNDVSGMLVLGNLQGKLINLLVKNQFKKFASSKIMPIAPGTYFTKYQHLIFIRMRSK